MARVAIRIDLGAGVSLGPGKIALIEAILRTGSISAAAREIGMSYRRAWLHVDALNRMFAEPSVVTSPGRRGGGAEVTAFGRPRRTEADFHEVRRRAGLVFQDPDDQLFCPTVREDVAFGPLNMGKTRAEAVAIVDAVLDRLGLMHLRDRITHHLSGGEKRLVTLAAVLAMDPEVLILDEPTNALDPDNEARLLAILQSLPQAIVLVCHDAGFRARLVGREWHLSGGRISPG